MVKVLPTVAALITGWPMRRFREHLQLEPLKISVTFHSHLTIGGGAAPSVCNSAMTRMLGIWASSVIANSGPGGLNVSATRGANTST
jgi:hypothetical protein